MAWSKAPRRRSASKPGGRDLGLEMAVRMHADSAAAIGICRRSGIGRVRHLAVGQLWVQEGLRRGDFELYKVRGDQNPADVLTKSVPREVLDRHLRTLGLERAEGRAASAPHAQLQELELPGAGNARRASSEVLGGRNGLQQGGGGGGGGGGAETPRGCASS